MATTRRQTHPTETTRRTATAARNAAPGRPRSATSAHLAERADALAHEPDLMVFHGTPGQPVALEDVTALPADADVEKNVDITDV